MRKPFKGWTIVTDLDGTLFSAADTICDENLNAISWWREGGGQFTIATGRYLGSVLPIYHQLQLDAPFIYNNGGSIYHPQTDTYHAVMEFGEEILAVLSDVLDRVPHCGVSCYDRNTLYLIRTNPAMERHLKRQHITPKIPEDSTVLKQCCKVLITVEPDEMTDMKQVLSKAPYFHHYHFTQSTERYYEITRIGATKGGLLSTLGELTETDFEHLVAVGDNENDWTLLETAPYSFAVANASPETQARAKFVTHSRGDTEAAIAEVIEIMSKILQEEHHGKI